MAAINDKYLTQITDVVPRSGRLAFRGHPDICWKLHSSATRRLLQELNGERPANVQRSLTFGRLYLSYHRSVLLEPARHYGFDTRLGHQDSDLQLLSKLQHLGAATGLLDFTFDSLVALWFATASPQSKQCPGRVVVVDLGDTLHYRRFPTPHDEQTLENIFPLSIVSNDQQFYCEPQFKDEASTRILRQRSVFIIGSPTGPEVAPMRIAAEIAIAAEDKVTLRGELERLFGVSEQTLFPDVHGFARANSPSAAISRLDDPEYFANQGSELYQRGEFERSIFAFDESIRLNPNLWMAYYPRGNANAQIGNYKDAKNDYSTALRLLKSASTTPRQTRSSIGSYIVMTVFNRGNMHYSLEEYKEACEDYSEAMSLASDEEQGALRYNRANARTKLGHFEAALEDYEYAIRLDVGHAIFNKGNALVALGRLRTRSNAIWTKARSTTIRKRGII